MRKHGNTGNTSAKKKDADRKTKPLGIRMTDRLSRKLERDAKRMKRSQSDHVRALIEDFKP